MLSEDMKKRMIITYKLASIDMFDAVSATIDRALLSSNVFELVVIIRCASRFRDNLRDFDETLLKAKQKLADMGADSDLLLEGI